MNAVRDVAILLFDDVEVLDFCGPFEVFSIAGTRVDPTTLRVFTVAESLRPIRTFNGLSVNPDRSLGDVPNAAVVVVPGGKGSRREMENPAVLRWLGAVAERAEIVLSICTGALLLGRRGLLDGLDVTTHHGALDLLRSTAPSARVHADRRFVDNGRIVTSAGIAAGIDASLHVVGRLLGESEAVRTAAHMEYSWEGSP